MHANLMGTRRLVVGMVTLGCCAYAARGGETPLTIAAKPLFAIENGPVLLDVTVTYTG